MHDCKHGAATLIDGGSEPGAGEPRRVLARRMLESVNELSAPLALPLCDPWIEIESPMLEIWGQAAVGHDGLRGWYSRLGRVFAFVEVLGVALREGDGWISGEVQMRARGVASRSELRWPAHVVLTFARDRSSGGERIAGIGVYLTKAEALEAIERYETRGTITSQRSRANAARTSSMRSLEAIPTIAPPDPA